MSCAIQTLCQKATICTIHWLHRSLSMSHTITAPYSPPLSYGNYTIHFLHNKAADPPQCHQLCYTATASVHYPITITVSCSHRVVVATSYSHYTKQWLCSTCTSRSMHCTIHHCHTISYAASFSPPSCVIQLVISAQWRHNTVTTLSDTVSHD